MAENFYTLVTKVGLAKITNAQLTSEKLNLATIVVGDGNGAYYNPTSDATALKKEVWRGAVGAVSVDDNNANWLVIETVVPATVGGFTVREVGLLDTAGDLIAIGKYPETYKPVLADGSSKDLYIRMIIEVANTSAVTLKVDPAIVIASRKYVDDKIAQSVGGVDAAVQEVKGGTITILPLQTTDKTLAGAINEVNAKADENASGLAAHLADDVNHVRYGTASGTNAKTIALSPVPTKLVEGMALSFKNTTANTGTVTLNVNGLGAKPVVKSNGNALSSGNLKAGSIYTVRYSGTSFILQGEGGEYGNVTPADVVLGKIFGTENGLMTGEATIQSLGGKRWASGTVSTSGRKVFTNAANGTDFTSEYIEISNLEFTPSTVLIRTVIPSLYGTLVSADAPKFNNYTTASLARTSNSVRIEDVSLNKAYLRYGGFSLPVESSETQFWIAFE